MSKPWEWLLFVTLSPLSELGVGRERMEAADNRKGERGALTPL